MENSADPGDLSHLLTQIKSYEMLRVPQKKLGQRG